MSKELWNQVTMTRRAMLRTMMIGGGVALMGDRLNLAHAEAAKDPLIAETIYGKIRGVQVNGVSMFAGVPYGATTEGAGRFMPPSKPEKWTDCSVMNKGLPEAQISVSKNQTEDIQRNINIIFR
jgi:hypothetical protein